MSTGDQRRIAHLVASAEFREMDRNIIFHVLHDKHSISVNSIAQYYHISRQRVSELLAKIPGTMPGRPAIIDDEALEAVEHAMHEHSRGITVAEATKVV